MKYAAFIAAISLLVCFSASADESDELNRAERIAYCFK